MHFKWITAAALAIPAFVMLAAGAALTGLVHAQAPGVPSTVITSPTGLEQITVQNTGPFLAQIQTRQARDAVGYQKSAALTGATVTFGASQSQVYLSAGSTIDALTIALTASPVDGQMNCFYGKSAITTLTMSATSPQTLNEALTSTSAATRYCYLYSLSNTSWDRVQ